MTEQELREKMQRGEPYNDMAPVLCERREYVNDVLREYNARLGGPATAEKREELLRKLFKKFGKNVFIETTFRCEFGYNITLGDNFYGNYDLVILDGGEVTFGDNVLVGPKCGFYTTNHCFDVEERRTSGVYSRPIRVGNNVWFCAGVTVAPGVSIGDGSIIGAGSVVTKDIPANVIAAGNPCRVIRPITDADKMGYQRD